MQLFERWWRRLSGGDAAERAELSGDLALAVRLWVASGEVDQAARVMVLRGDAEPDPKLRLQHFTQAAATATHGSAIQKQARVKRARLTLALAEAGSLSAALRQDVLDAAAVLEGAGEASLAAAAYALAGDIAGEARALVEGGEVERLEQVLERDEARTKWVRRRDDVHASVEGLVSTGRRREALALAVRHPDDPVLVARAARLRGAMARPPIVRVALRGLGLALVLGDDVSIGRTEGEIRVGSSALSRKHLRLARDGARFLATDLGTRNGTQLRGLNLAHPLDVGAGVRLTLGGEVTVGLGPATEMDDSLAIDVAAARYVAPLREATLGIGDWVLVAGDDGWVELRTGPVPPYAGNLTLATTVTLLRGDTFSAERGGEIVLRVEE